MEAYYKLPVKNIPSIISAKKPEKIYKTDSFLDKTSITGFEMTYNSRFPERSTDDMGNRIEATSEMLLKMYHKMYDTPTAVEVS